MGSLFSKFFNEGSKAVPMYFRGTDFSYEIGHHFNLSFN